MGMDFTGPALPADQWQDLRDHLSDALEALGDTPEDFNVIYLSNAILHQREALRLCHRRARALGRNC